MLVYILSERYLNESYDIIGVFNNEPIAWKYADAIKRRSSDGWALDFKVQEFEVQEK
jgi:hypothetical protein